MPEMNIHDELKRRAAAAAFEALIHAVDALEGTYVILLNGYPLDPGDSFMPGDRLEIQLIDVPEEEERHIVEAVEQLNGKGFRVSNEEDTDV